MFSIHKRFLLGSVLAALRLGWHLTPLRTRPSNLSACTNGGHIFVMLHLYMLTPLMLSIFVASESGLIASVQHEVRNTPRLFP